jgi:uroporphyrinogen-III synthase
MNLRQRVFVSRDKAELVEIPELANRQGIALVCVKMIDLVPLNPLPALDGVDVLFFSSPRAVELFYSQPAYADHDLPVAAIGAGTAKALPNHANCIFIGEGQTTEAVTEFIRQGWDGKLGVVEGERSRRVFDRVAAAIHPTSNHKNVVIYKTKPRPQAIGGCDAWAFTSPSNFEAFLLANPRPPAKKCIAIGETTASAIGRGVHVAANYSEKALWDAILSALRS